MILFEKLHKDAKIPKINNEGDAGFDFYANEDAEIFTNQQKLISTGIKCGIPSGWLGLIKPRSGLAVRNQLDTRAGVIDAPYRGEVKLLLRNEGEGVFKIKRGDRVAQMIVIPCMTESAEAFNLPNSVRGSDGFGSSGV